MMLSLFLLLAPLHAVAVGTTTCGCAALGLVVGATMLFCEDNRVVTKLRRTEESRRVPQAAGGGRLADHQLLTDLYTTDGAFLGKGGCGAIFHTTRKRDGMPMVVKQQFGKHKETKSEIDWGRRSIKQGFGSHNNLCLVEDAFDPSGTSGGRPSWPDYSHLIMRKVKKGTTEDYGRIGFDVPDPAVLDNAELFELAEKEVPLVTRTKLAGVCVGDIQCAFARIAMQTLCGVSALQKIHSEEASARRITIVHQDIKPENILLGKFGASPGASQEQDVSAKIIDLGLARASSATAQIIGGTPAYFAPETILSLAPESNSGPERTESVPVFKAAGDTFAAGLSLMFFMNLSGSRPVSDGEKLSASESSRKQCLVPGTDNQGNRFTVAFQQDMDNEVLRLNKPQEDGIVFAELDEGRQQ